MFASAKGKQQKYVRQLQSSGTVYRSYPILPFGIVASTFFPTTFLEIAVYNRALSVIRTLGFFLLCLVVSMNNFYPIYLVSKISFESFSVPERHDKNSFMEVLKFKDMVAAEEHIQDI